MIKYFCDRCGKEIEEEKVSVVTCIPDKGETEPFEVCPYCYNSVMDL